MKMLRAFYMRHVCATYPASLAILDLIILMFCEEWNYDVSLCAVFSILLVFSCVTFVCRHLLSPISVVFYESVTKLHIHTRQPENV